MARTEPALPRGFRKLSLSERIDYVQDGEWKPLERALQPAVRIEREIARFLEECLENATLLVDKVRAAWLAWCERQSLGTEAAP